MTCRTPAAGTSNIRWDTIWFDAHWGTLLSADYTWLGEHANESPNVLRRNEAALTAAVIWTF